MMLTFGFQGLFALERRGDVLRKTASLSLAALAHAGLAFGARYVEPKARPAMLAVTEIEMLPPAPSAEREAPTPPPPAPARAEPVRARASAPRTRPAPPQAPTASAAAAGKLLTADEAAPSAQEPVRFATDPNGTSYGIGVVAQGGSSAVGTGTHIPLPSEGNHEGPAPAPKLALSRPPQLAANDPCRGYFPTAAQVDRGEASVLVHVSAAGRVTSVRVVSEQPSGEGFGAAAQRCLRAAPFGPALDVQGRAVGAMAPVTVRFSR